MLQMFKNKKGIEIAWSMIIKAILVLIGIIMAIIILRSFLGQGFSALEGFSLF